MAELTFHHAAMNAGKSTLLLQAAHNHRERGLGVLLVTAGGGRHGEGMIGSRVGLGAPAETFGPATDLAAMARARLARGPLACVLVDEAQFLGEAQVWGLASVVDELGVAVACYGLRTDFAGRLFPGSAALLAIADELREVRAVCHCGRPAIMTARRAPGGFARSGEQVMVGGEELYEALCRRHWRAAVGR